MSILIVNSHFSLNLVASGLGYPKRLASLKLMIEVIDIMFGYF